MKGTFDRNDIIFPYLERDYVRALRAGLERRETAPDFEIDLLLIQALARLDQEAAVQALAGEILRGCGASPWLRFLAEISLGIAELVDPEEVEAGARRCHYLYFAGERLLTAGERARAAAFFVDCVRQGHDCLEHALAKQQLASLEAGDPGPAVEMESTFSQLDGDAVRRVRAGDLGGAVATMEELVDLAEFFRHERTLEWVSTLALLYREAGRSEESRRLVERQLERDLPLARRLELLVQLAETSIREGAYEDARDRYLELLELTSDDPARSTARAQALNGLGVVYLRLGDPPRARGVLRDALELRRADLGQDHPETAVTLHNLGEASIPSNPAEAESCYRQAVEILRRADSEGSHRLGLAYLSLGVFLRACSRDREAIEPLEAGLEVVAKLPELPGDELPGELSRNLEEARRALAGPPARSAGAAPASAPADLEWWRRDDRPSPDSLRVQLQSSVEMSEVLLRCLVSSFGELADQVQGEIARLEMLHYQDGQVDHLGVELASEHGIVPFVRGISSAFRERRDPVAVRGDERLTEMLLRLPNFGRPTEDGGLPPVPPPPAPPPVDEDPEILLSDAELQELLASRIFVPSVVELVEGFRRGDEGTAIDSLRPVFLEGRSDQVHALYRALVRRWSRSFRVPEHVLRTTRFLMGERWSPAAGDWLSGLHADFDVRPADDVHEDGAPICEIYERRAVLALAEDPLVFLGNLVSGFSEQWKEMVELMPETSEKIVGTVSFSDPAWVKLLVMVRRALGYADRTLRPHLETEKPLFGLGNVGHPHWTVAGTPPFSRPAIQTVRGTIAEQSDSLKRRLDAAR